MSSDLEGDLNQDGIIDEMDRVRGNLDGQIDELGASVRQLFDWQAYVRSAPITSVSAAAFLGFLLAPKVIPRSAPEPVFVPQAGTAASPGIGKTLMAMVMAGVAKAGSVYLADIIARNFAATPDSESTTESRYGRHEPPYETGL